MKVIYPVPSRFIPGVPAVKQRVSDSEAAYLVGQEAFSYDPPPREAEPTQPEGPAETPGLLISEE